MHLSIDAGQDEFGTFTHRLRNPLTSIQGCALTLLQREDLPVETRRTLVRVIAKQAQALETVLRTAEGAHATRAHKAG